MQLFGAPAHRRHAVLLGAVSCEIVAQQAFESGQHVAVDVVARDELPFVEPRAVIQQQLDVRDDQRAAVFVDRVFQFRLDVQQAVQHDLAFLLREVQGFVHLVGEKRVARDVAPERRAAQQVGMEQQRPAFGLVGLPVVFVADDLPRGQEDERALLVVVIVASVAQVAALHLLEKYGIKAVDLPFEAGGAAFRKVDDAHQRMQRLHAARFVELEDVVVFNHRVHVLNSFVCHKINRIFDTCSAFRPESVIMVRRTVIGVCPASVSRPTFAVWNCVKG